jgi:hypothetical protein
MRSVDQHWIDLFDDRYGVGAFARLLTLLNTPCTSFAEIAAGYGVSRERVRQWHLQLLPGAPRGHQRRRLCIREHQRRELLTDPLFRTFYRHARARFQPGELVLIPTRTGYRRRAVRLAGRLVAIKSARSTRAVRVDGAATYVLSSPGRSADYIYYQLSADAYLFLPGELLPASSTTFIDNEQSKYARFRNSFIAAQVDAGAVLPAGDALGATSGPTT